MYSRYFGGTRQLDVVGDHDRTGVQPASLDDALQPLDTPECAAHRNCNVNLDDPRWDRPDLDCEPQQARGIRRNLQLDETGGDDRCGKGRA
jgi:hypothetical protein